MYQTPTAGSYPVTTEQVDEGHWTVTVATHSYPFTDPVAAATFAAAAAGSTAALVEWSSRAHALLRQMEGHLAEAGLLRVLYEDNHILDLLLSVPVGELMPGVELSLLRMLSIGCFFQDLTAHLGGAVVGVPPAPVPEGAMGMRRVVITLRD